MMGLWITLYSLIAGFFCVALTDMKRPGIDLVWWICVSLWPVIVVAVIFILSTANED
jgi:hypothetical protein